ncbi:MAG: restriction endonuclease subunit M, partial [Deltaproteobacteria bacterium HGW-Deltaproteobacteria-17]
MTMTARPLQKSLRGQLEKVIQDARAIAETAARASLSHLGVAEPGAPAYLTESEKELRRRLRAHGRGLGDRLESATDVQSIDLLVEEVAYEHWHRMLFARFLAENELLVMTTGAAPVPVTLAECDELASETGAQDGWELASRLAARMLPQIFRPDSPVFSLTLPREHQGPLERLVISLPGEVFLASDALGWVYQYWQARKKDEVNASHVKIGARELPAVTQLFTEPYMVAFLLDNALGAWWALQRLTDEDLRTATSEDQLRAKAAIPGVPLTYLRFVRDDAGAWRPAAGRFDAWPKRLAELKVLDPCCGSGHFLVAALHMLVPMRRHAESLTVRQAVDAVLAENLHGLELDRRCVELAAFALALAAWTQPGSGGYRPLPALRVACSGLSVGAAKEEWKALALGRHNLRIALDWMHEVFAQAPTLGSLIDPARTQAAALVSWDELAGLLDQALSREEPDERHEAVVTARGLSDAARLLAGRYHWVITNVPYLGRNKQDEALRTFCEQHYPEAKTDLATVFLQRCLELCQDSAGVVSVVLPQSWLFLGSYRKYREKLLTRDTWRLIARLGPGAFEAISGEVVKAVLLTISAGGALPTDEADSLFASAEPDRSPTNGLITGLDVADLRCAADKDVALRTTEIKVVSQAKQMGNPDARVALEEGESGELLEKFGYSHEGLTTGDLERFVIKFWETEVHGVPWNFYIQNSQETSFYSGRDECIRWGENGEIISSFPGSFIKGRTAWGNLGIRVTQMNKLPLTLYSGELFGKNAATLLPHDPAHLPAIWCFCSSPEYNEAVRQIDQSLKVTNATLVKVPFDLARWTQVAQEQYPHGLPQPFSDDPTQWIFHGHPCGSVIWDEPTKTTAHGALRQDDTVLQVAVARLLGYRWPAELDVEMALAPEQRAWVQRCESLLSHQDDDGIVCITPVRGEQAADERLLNLLADAYGDAWRPELMSRLLASVDCPGWTLSAWLREKFFAQHCKLFQNRPFIWQIWDGLRDGFSALVHYHRFDRKTLEALIYTYLGDWIVRQKAEHAAGVDGAMEKLAAAENLKKRLELILEGEAPYDIFVRWKPLSEQPIGWEPDLDDGVRLN